MELSRRCERLAACCLVLLVLGASGCATRVDRETSCRAVASWIDPGTNKIIPHDQLIRSLAGRPVVLLGERHDDRDHHRWQLHTIAALHAYRPAMALGFEMFPRRTQPVLDRWVGGELTAEAFLDAVDWAETWGYDADLYLPLFHFARQHRLPMLALNVDRDLVARVGREGWSAVPTEQREGLSDPAPPPERYRRSLAELYATKKRGPAGNTESGTDVTAEEISDVLADPAFERFVEAQLTWDRAMAEAITQAHAASGGALIVGIIGRGHVEHHWGVPHQLAALGVDDAAVLLPVALQSGRADVETDVADYVFLLDATSEAPRRKQSLGVVIGSGADGVRVDRVIAGSVAEAAGIRADDVIVRAAGIAVDDPGGFVETIQRQPSGTWLPLTVRRGQRTLELVARFPAYAPPP